MDAYRARAAQLSDFQRTEQNKDKSGVFTGAYAVNPVNQARIPIWVADYVLMSYGTGAIMAVPAHDERDHEFATKFQLPIVQVILPPAQIDVMREAYDGDGVLINSGFLDGLTVADAKARIIGNGCEDKGVGTRKIQYRLRDWLFSRQRYWGEPIPVLHRQDGSVVPLPEDALPLLPPQLDEYRPTETRRTAAGARHGLGQDHRPGNRRAGLARDQHDAAMGGFLLVLPALHRSEERRRAGRSREGTLLDAGRPLCRRRRACGAASAVCAVLAQGAVRHWRRFDQGAVQAAVQPGHDPGLLLSRRQRQIL